MLIPAINPDPKIASTLDLCQALGHIQDILGFIFKFAVVLAVLMVAWGGLQYGLAFGDEAKSGKAKGIITAAVAGLVIIFLSIGMVTTVWNIFLKNGNPTGPGLDYLAFLRAESVVDKSTGLVNNKLIKGCENVDIPDPNAKGAASGAETVEVSGQGAAIPPEIMQAIAASDAANVRVNAPVHWAKGPCLGQHNGFWVDVVTGKSGDETCASKGYKSGDPKIDLSVTNGSILKYSTK